MSVNHTDVDIRGNAKNRRQRRQWLLTTFGDGKSAPCFHCQKPLTDKTLEVDRYPVCGHDGGRYVHGNIVPACADCNKKRCPTCRGNVAPRRELRYQTRLSDDPDGPAEDAVGAA